MVKNKLLKFSLFLFLILIFQTNTKADIFDGGSGGGGGGIFDGIRQGFEGIFDGIRGVFPGGASIPGVPPPTATPTPNPLYSPTPTPTGMVPPRNEGKSLKLTLEWDTQSLGGESVYPETEDPLKCIHLGKNEPGCGDTNFPGMIFCPCASTPGGRATNLKLDNKNRLILVYEQSSDQQVDASEVPQEPNPPNPGGPPLPPAPIIWEVCVNDTKCLIAALTHVLTGWCGHNPVILDSGAYNKIGSKVPPQTAGPNSFTLPNAVSNKFIRRDGYAYSCVSDCAGTKCIIDNYVEFQTMIYPSNAISMSLNVENPGTQKVENIMVKINTASNSPSGETPLPHNVDVLATKANTPLTSPLMNNTYYTNPYIGSTTSAVGGWGYVHGDEINENTQINWQFNSTIPQTVKKVADPNEINRFIYQFQIGSFDLNPGEKKILDFQPAEAEFSKIPSTQQTYPSQDLKLVPAAKPCECQSVKIHDALGVDATGCDKSQTKPTIAMCLLYYGIGVKLRSNPADPNSATDFRAHSGGYSCDLQGIPVEGCPPPWCFDGAVSTVGPFDKCPDWNGDGVHTEADRIPNPNTNNPDGTPKANPETHETIHWFERSGMYEDPTFKAKYGVSYIANETQATDIVAAEQPNLITTIVNAIIPRKVLEFTGLRPVEVSAFGCTHPCKNVPPPGLLGLGRLIPRDYNFICSPTDLYTPTDLTSMVEKERCDGSDYGIEKTIIHPQDVNTFKTYRDVTGLRGCGYNASSNNSVIGPIQVMAEYNGTNEDNRTGRSVLLASIPVGGRLVDDQARPYGWPVTGEIEQDWGYTGEATNRGPYRSQPWYDYNEYRYCSAMDIINPQDPVASGVNCNVSAIITDPSKNNVKPLAQLITDLTNSNVHNWIADLTHWDQTENSTIKNLTKCYNDVINRAIISGNDPAYVMATWLEESAASNYDSFPDVSDFGCISSSHSNFNAQISCMTGLQRDYSNDSTFAACRDREATGDPMDGKMNVDKFQQLFSGGSTECVNKTHVANANFYSKIRYTYSIVHKNASVLKNCVLMTDNWSSGTCSVLPTLP